MPNMRLATMKDDYWQLRSAEESHRANPEKFWIPPLEQRQNLSVGQAARLIFDIESTDENGNTQIQGERMWVIVAERVGDQYIGILDNRPASIEPSGRVYLRFGAEIPFAAAHVIDIACPPEDYVKWQLGQAPESRWPRE